MDSQTSITRQEDMLKHIAQVDATFKVIGKKFAYGTAGFRTLGDTLDRVCFRAGILAGIRAKVHGGLAGVMVTASHNPKQDNGLKIFEKDGSMLYPAWERLAEGLVNAENLPEFLTELNQGKLAERFPGLTDLQEDLFSKVGEVDPIVFIGMDTRESSQRLCDAVALGLQAIGVTPINFGLVTTPQLHWLTQRCNELRSKDPS